MLVLSRKLNQSIQIGNEITVTVVSVKGNTVRLGISAPDHVRVARTELRSKELEAQELQRESHEVDARPTPARKSNPISLSDGPAEPNSSFVIEFQTSPDHPVSFQVAQDSPESAALAKSETHTPLGSRLPRGHRQADLDRVSQRPDSLRKGSSASSESADPSLLEQLFPAGGYRVVEARLSEEEGSVK